MFLPLVLTAVVVALSPDANSQSTEPEFLEKLKSHVVKVQLPGGDSGSAIIVDTDKLVTNCHVVEHDTGTVLNQTIVLDEGGESQETRLVARHEDHDVCLLSIDGQFSFPAAMRVSLSSSPLKKGDRVYTVGAPYGQNDFISKGVISSLPRYSDFHIVDRNKIELCDRTERKAAWYIQTDATIVSGSSGGGLFNETGELIGITTLRSSKGDKGPGLALPVDRVKELLAVDPIKAEKELAENLATEGNFTDALQIANNIAVIRDRVNALLYIARIQVKTNHRSGAEETVAHIIGTAYQMSVADGRAELLRNIVEVLVDLQIFDVSILTAGDIHDTEERSEAFWYIARDLAKRGYFDSALNIARDIPNAGIRSDTLLYISKELARKNNFTRASQVAKEISDAEVQVFALDYIRERTAIRLFRDGQLAGAVQETLGIVDVVERIRTLQYVATEQAKAGSNSGAQIIFATATKAAQLIGDFAERSEVLANIAGDQAGVGYELAARRVFFQAIRVAKQIGDPAERDRALSYLVWRLARVSNFEKAMELVPSIGTLSERGRALSHIVGALAEVREFGRAILLAQSIGVLEERVHSFRNIAEALADDEQFARAIDLVAGMPTGIERAEALFYIAEKSDEPKASAYMALAVAAADEIENEGERDRMLSTILGAQLKGNHFGGAWSTMPKIQTERYYSRSVRHFAVAAARSGHVEMAELWVGKLSRCYPLEKKIAISEIERVKIPYGVNPLSSRDSTCCAVREIGTGKPQVSWRA